MGHFIPRMPPRFDFCGCPPCPLCYVWEDEQRHFEMQLGELARQRESAKKYKAPQFVVNILDEITKP